MKREVIIACDFKDKETLFGFLGNNFKDEKPYLKVGMELYYAEGAELVKRLKGEGYKIFLDLKIHDIPNTAAAAAKQLAKLKTDMINVHAAGGKDMMRAAAAAAKEISPSTKVIAVTQLTSTSDSMLRNELLIDCSMEETVIRYAINTKDAGLDGVVCSALECKKVKKIGLEAVTPGIRFAGGDANDQKRVATPALAAQNGSDYIVMGRAITGAENPYAAYKRAVKEFTEEYND